MATTCLSAEPFNWKVQPLVFAADLPSLFDVVEWPESASVLLSTPQKDLEDFCLLSKSSHNASSYLQLRVTFRSARPIPQHTPEDEKNRKEERKEERKKNK